MTVSPNLGILIDDVGSRKFCALSLQSCRVTYYCVVIVFSGGLTRSSPTSDEKKRQRVDNRPEDQRVGREIEIETVVVGCGRS